MNADRKLEARAAALAIRHLSGRTYQVASGSGGKPHIVRGAVDQPLGEWTCDCVGAAGRENWCSHKRAVAQDLMIADRPARPAPTKLSSSPCGRAGGGMGPSPAPQGVTTGGTMHDELQGFMASIPLIQSAVKVAGDGGVRLTIDVSDNDYDAVMDFVRQARGQVFRLIPIWDTEENDDS